MPVVSEKSEGTRRVPRRWLVAGTVFLGLLLLLPLVPFVTPVALHVGDRWLIVFAQSDVDSPQRLWAGAWDSAAVTKPYYYPFFWPKSDRNDWPQIAQNCHLRWVAFGRLGYGACWFDAM